MLAKKLRLTDKESFQRVHKEGRVFQSANFGVATYKRGDEEPSRFSFVVSTKIAKDAVDRNRLRRIMSEAVRILSNELTPGYDVIFLAKLSITKFPTSEIMKEVGVALTESGLRK